MYIYIYIYIYIYTGVRATLPRLRERRVSNAIPPLSLIPAPFRLPDRSRAHDEKDGRAPVLRTRLAGLRPRNPTQGPSQKQEASPPGARGSTTRSKRQNHQEQEAAPPGARGSTTSRRAAPWDSRAGGADRNRRAPGACAPPGGARTSADERIRIVSLGLE